MSSPNSNTARIFPVSKTDPESLVDEDAPDPAYFGISSIDKNELDGLEMMSTRGKTLELLPHEEELVSKVMRMNNNKRQVSA